LQKKGLILFDIDGVIRDVSNSYRLAVKKTVYKFCGWEPTSSDIDNLKNEGLWNNDWDLSLELIRRFIKKNHQSINLPHRNEIIKIFEKLYFGCDINEDYSNWCGFITNERILVDKNLFEELSINRIGWGFVSGAESASAKFVLEKKLNLKKPPLIAMGDAPDKPDPEGLLNLASKLLPNKLGINSPPIAYVGDTVADVKTVINARKVFPNQTFISIAIAPPHLHSNNSFQARIAYESKLNLAGADLILKSINEIKDKSIDFF